MWARQKVVGSIGEEWRRVGRKVGKMGQDVGMSQADICSTLLGPMVGSPILLSAACPESFRIEAGIMIIIIQESV